MNNVTLKNKRSWSYELNKKYQKYSVFVFFKMHCVTALLRFVGFVRKRKIGSQLRHTITIFTLMLVRCYCWGTRKPSTLFYFPWENHRRPRFRKCFGNIFRFHGSIYISTSPVFPTHTPGHGSGGHNDTGKDANCYPNSERSVYSVNRVIFWVLHGGKFGETGR